MIDYKKNLLFILVFISGFILFIVYSYTAEKMIYNETCTAQGNRESKSIRRNIEYTWIENYDTAHLTSKKVNKFEIMDQVDDDRLAELIPDFYVFPEKSVSYNILKQGKHAFILSIGNRAIMHCAR